MNCPRRGSVTTRRPPFLSLVLLFALGLAPAVPLPGQGGRVHPVADGAELLAAVPLLQAGDTVLLTGSEYLVSTLHLSGVVGTESAWITFRAATGRARLVATAYQDVIRIDDCSYLRFEDLEITTQLTAAGINGVVFYNGTSSDHISFDGCWIHGCSSNGIKSQAVVLDHLRVENTEISDCDLCGIYLGFPSPLLIAADTVVRNCYIHDCSAASSGYGIQIKGGSYGSIIENNVLHDVGAPTRAAIAIYWADTQGNQPPERWSIVRDNVIWNSPNEGIFVTNSAVIENNVIFDVPRGIVASSYAGYAIDNLVIRNNTLFRCSSRGLSMNGFGTYAAGSVVVANNAVFVTDPGAEAYYASNGTGAATFASNGYHGACSGVSSGLVALGSPSAELLDASGTAGSLDLYPASGGGMVGAGNRLLASEWDVNGTRRDRSQPVCLGAYERTTAANPGWRPEPGPKPLIRGLVPARQEIATGSGGVASLQLRTAVPPGRPYLLLVSRQGPTAGGPLPLWPDPWTLLPFGAGTDAFFAGYFGITSEGGAGATLDVPALGLPLTLTLYHAAVLFDPATLQVLETTPPARVLLTP